MKFLIAMILTLGASTSFAMQEAQISECILTNQNNIQTHIGLYQQLMQELYGDEIEAISDMGDQLVQKLSADTVVTCADAELVIVETYLAGLKQKKTAKQSE